MRLLFVPASRVFDCSLNSHRVFNTKSALIRRNPPLFHRSRLLMFRELPTVLDTVVTYMNDLSSMWPWLGLHIAA